MDAMTKRFFRVTLPIFKGVNISQGKENDFPEEMEILMPETAGVPWMYLNGVVLVLEPPSQASITFISEVRLLIWQWLSSL
jgi:hypothetical protein